jgi:hypothetical protein
MESSATIIQKVLKKRAAKLKKEAQEEALGLPSVAQAAAPIIPVQKRNYEFSVDLEPDYRTDTGTKRAIKFKFVAFLSRNEKAAMDELLAELKQNFVGNFRNENVIRDRVEKLYKMMVAKINEYSIDFVKALKQLFDGLLRPSMTIQGVEVKGLYIILFEGAKTKDNRLTVSLVQQILNLINNRLGRYELEQQPEIMESIPVEVPTVVPPSFIETKPSFEAPQVYQPGIETVRELIKSGLEKKGKKKIVIRNVAEKLRQEAERIAREEAERLALEGLGLTKTQKQVDLFGMLDPAVLEGKGTKISPQVLKAHNVSISKKLIKALIGEGHKIKKVAKPNDARRVRGQKIKELMKSNPGMTLAQASKKLKEMKNC